MASKSEPIQSTVKSDTLASSDESSLYDVTSDVTSDDSEDCSYTRTDEAVEVYTDNDSTSEMETDNEYPRFYVEVPDEARDKCLEVIRPYLAATNYNKVIDEYKAKHLGSPPFGIRLTWTVNICPDIKKARLPSQILKDQNPPKSYFDMFYEWLFCQDTVKDTIAANKGQHP